MEDVMTRFVVSMGLASVLACASFGALAQSKASDRASQTFITKAIEGNLAEVEMGRLAQEKGESEGVRSFGQTLQQDHAAGAQKATAVATQLGVNPPTEPNKNQKAMHASLGKLSGQAFDRKFASEMVKDHKKEIAEYQKAAKKQSDPAGAYASETLPTLQKHLQTAQALTKATSAR
jgi:putative membrane protein